MSDNESNDESTNVIPLVRAGMTPQEAQKVLNQKWGKDTMDANYAVIPSALLRGQARLGINATELAVLIHLIDHWWKADEMPWPSKKTLADRLMMGEKAVQRAMRKLEEAKLVERKPRFNKTGARTSNEYDLSPLVERLRPIAKDMIEASKQAKEIKRKAERPGLKTRAQKKAVAK